MDFLVYFLPLTDMKFSADDLRFFSSRGKQEEKEEEEEREERRRDGKESQSRYRSVCSCSLLKVGLAEVYSASS